MAAPCATRQGAGTGRLAIALESVDDLFTTTSERVLPSSCYGAMRFAFARVHGRISLLCQASWLIAR
jgi:hypothetical protein